MIIIFSNKFDLTTHRVLDGLELNNVPYLGTSLKSHLSDIQ